MRWHEQRKIIIRVWLTLSTVLVLCKQVRCGPQNVCPIYCQCNLRNSLNHADCSDKRLISPNTAVPYEVQSLDLSYNDITVLDNECFQGYIYMINITISNNAINTIFLDTFVPLKRIRSIDLSYNRLEYIDPRTFETNRNLRKLNLEGNKFMTLKNEPLLQSKYLRVLNLAHAQINVLLPEHYSKLPQLVEVNLAYNLIITIDKFADQVPKHLKRLKLEGNNLNCDKALKSSIEKLMERNVQVTFSDCEAVNSAQKQIDGVVKKFERLELKDEHVLVKGKKEEEEEIDGDLGDSQEEFNDTIRSGVLSGWHSPFPLDEYEDYYADSEVDQNEEYKDIFVQEKSINETCRLWCLKSLPKTSFNFGGKQYTDFDLLFVFICGIAVGVALTIFIGSCIICIWRCATLKATSVHLEDPYGSHYAVVSQAHPSTRSTVDTVRTPSLRDTESAHEHVVPFVSPQPPRRRRQRRTAAAHSRALERHDQLVRSGGDNFISRLFGRPARHQYYRTINENTATLIRRLSRSNLFNNRLSQHFVDRELNATSSAPITPDSPDGISTQAMENDLEEVERTSAITPHRRRPETPPPLYSEIVAKSLNESS